MCLLQTAGSVDVLVLLVSGLRDAPAPRSSSLPWGQELPHRISSRSIPRASVQPVPLRFSPADPARTCQVGWSAVPDVLRSLCDGCDIRRRQNLCETRCRSQRASLHLPIRLLGSQLRAALHVAAERMSQILSLQLCAGGCRALKRLLPGQVPGRLRGRAGMRLPSLGSGAETAAARGRWPARAGVSQSSGGESSRPWDRDIGVKKTPAAGKEVPSTPAHLPVREDSEHGSSFSLAPWQSISSSLAAMGKTSALLCHCDKAVLTLGQSPPWERGVLPQQAAFWSSPHADCLSFGKRRDVARAPSSPSLCWGLPQVTAAAPRLHPFLSTSSRDVSGFSAEASNTVSSCKGLFVSWHLSGRMERGQAARSAPGRRQRCSPARCMARARWCDRPGELLRAGGERLEPQPGPTFPGSPGACRGRLWAPALRSSDRGEPALPSCCRGGSGRAVGAEAVPQPRAAWQPLVGQPCHPLHPPASAPGPALLGSPAPARGPCSRTRRRFAGKAGRKGELNPRKKQLNYRGIKISLFSLPWGKKSKFLSLPS